ncbi:MAG: YbfB/YjiJ family MFS transporter [Rhodobiaceae bacterium]|nr:YbfB/YjiJ family MFS transporter [Rhodobiaceae bacterium]MCC0056805.1 YbfB/YjiJ family MFS transporter [Rhodobiaceae bacterium]
MSDIMTSTGRQTAGNRLAVLTIVAGGMIVLASSMGIGRFVYTPILPVMANALDLSAAQTGLLASVNLVAYLAGAIAASSRFMRGSPHFWLIGGLVVLALSTIATGMVSNMPALIFMRVLAGASTAIALIFGMAIVTDRLARLGRVSLAGLQFGGVGFGMVVSAVLVAWLTASGFGWRSLWYAGGAAVVVGIVLTALLLPGGGEDRTASDNGEPLRGTGFITMVLSYGLFGFGYIITATFIVAIVHDSERLAFLQPYIWMAVGLAGMPSTYLWNFVSARIGFAKMYAVGCIVEAIGVALSVSTEIPVLIVLSAALLGGTMMALTGSGFSHVREIATGSARRLFAVMTVSFSIGQVSGPIIAGWLYDLQGSFFWGSMAAVAALILAAGLSLLSEAQARRASNIPA